MPKLAPKRGLLIAIEGLDRSGKTTQVAKMVDYFTENKILATSIKFPDRSTLVGMTIDDYLRGKKRMSDQVIHLLFSSNRWELQEQIKNDLNNGVNVILDRYAYSGVAYSSAKGLNLNWCKNCDRGLPKPDLVIFLKINELETAKRGGYGDEVYEKVDFQNKVKQQYNLLLEKDWRIVNAN